MGGIRRTSDERQANIFVADATLTKDPKTISDAVGMLECRTAGTGHRAGRVRRRKTWGPRRPLFHKTLTDRGTGSAVPRQPPSTPSLRQERTFLFPKSTKTAVVEIHRNECTLALFFRISRFSPTLDPCKNVENVENSDFIRGALWKSPKSLFCQGLISFYFTSPSSGIRTTVIDYNTIDLVFYNYKPIPAYSTQSRRYNFITKTKHSR